MIQSPTTPSLSTAELRTHIQGSVIAPDDLGYAEASTVRSGESGRPAAIIRSAIAADVVRTVALARETGFELAVRSGGHSAAGHGTTDGGIVLDLSAMKKMEIDVDGRTVWAEAGLTAAELTAAVGEHGLAIGFGDTGSVGIGGITLGGGVGFLSRKHGLTIDNLLAADVALADGSIVRADEDHEPDLFWAIRGGGGNFGVVTRFQFGLHSVPNVVGGMLMLPATPDIIAGFVTAAEAAPDELSTIANILSAPPLPFVPAEVRGQLVVLALMAYAGDAASGQEALAPFRALGTPIVDMVRPMAYGELFPAVDPNHRPISANRTMFLDHVDEVVARVILDRLDEHLRMTNAEVVVAQLRVLGGAIGRVSSEATAYAHRKNRIMANFAVMVPSRADIPAHEAWLAGISAALDQGVEGAYVNFVGDEGRDRVSAAYPGATWQRLAEIKRRYDPTNLFHLNQNIPPAGV
jgi:FAD/FMN-containing dehydrogenase